jgi:hypothetical protein
MSTPALLGCYKRRLRALILPANIQASWLLRKGRVKVGLALLVIYESRVKVGPALLGITKRAGQRPGEVPGLLQLLTAR